MQYLYGKPIAERILWDIKTRIEKNGYAPGLAAMLIGDDAASHLYVGLKKRAALETGFHFEEFLLPESVSEAEILQCIDETNRRDDLQGIIVQLPLPGQFSADRIVERISPAKDADGFHRETLRRFFAGDISACPVFPRAIVELVRSSGERIRGERATAIVNSELLGKVLVRALENEGLAAGYVLSLHPREIIAKEIKHSKVVVTACGVTHSLTGEMLGDGTIVIDGGISRHAGQVVGDVHRKSVEKKALYLSPVPGGVGPVTIACLLERTLLLAEQARQHRSSGTSFF